MKRVLRRLRCFWFHDGPLDLIPAPGMDPLYAIWLGRCYCRKCGEEVRV
jgi:hypothetical protein